MVIPDRHIGGAGLGPAKNNPPLVVHPDGVETGEPAFQGLQPITWGNGKVLQFSGVVHLEKFAQSHPRNGREATAGLVDKQVFRIFVGEGLDHGIRPPAPH